MRVVLILIFAVFQEASFAANCDYTVTEYRNWHSKLADAEKRIVGARAQIKEYSEQLNNVYPDRLVAFRNQYDQSKQLFAQTSGLQEKIALSIMYATQSRKLIDLLGYEKEIRNRPIIPTIIAYAKNSQELKGSPNEIEALAELGNTLENLLETFSKMGNVSNEEPLARVGTLSITVYTVSLAKDIMEQKSGEIPVPLKKSNLEQRSVLNGRVIFSNWKDLTFSQYSSVADRVIELLYFTEDVINRGFDDAFAIATADYELMNKTDRMRAEAKRIISEAEFNIPKWEDVIRQANSYMINWGQVYQNECNSGLPPRDSFRGERGAR